VDAENSSKVYLSTTNFQSTDLSPDPRPKSNASIDACYGKTEVCASSSTSDKLTKSTSSPTNSRTWPKSSNIPVTFTGFDSTPALQTISENTRRFQYRYHRLRCCTLVERGCCYHTPPVGTALYATVASPAIRMASSKDRPAFQRSPPQLLLLLLQYQDIWGQAVLQALSGL
jgi:hypothetical protein